MDLKNLADCHSGAFIQQFSSCRNEFLTKPENVLTSNQKQYWQSKQGLPQYLTINLQKVKIRYDKISFIGFDCWHNYASNPKVINIFVKQNSDQDNEDFQHWITLKAKQKSGKQIFQINPQLSSNFKIIKFQIQQTFEQFQTYLNQIFIYGQIQQQKEQEMTSRHFNNFFNQMQYKQTDRYDLQQAYYEPQSKYKNKSYQSQQFESDMNILGINKNVIQLQQAMQQLNRRVDQLDFKVGISHNSIEDKIMEKVNKLIDLRIQQKQQSKFKKSQKKFSQQQNHRIKMLAQKLNQKMKQRQMKILQISRKRSERKRNYDYYD